MSTYKITFSSLHNAWANDEKISAVGQDDGDSSNPYTDETYTLHLTLDGALVANGDIDGSGTLSFTTDLSVADHQLIVTIQGAKDSGVCIDKFEIDDKEMVASRLKYNNVTAGGSDILRWQLSEMWRSSDVDDTYNCWWPRISEASSFLDANFPYRPNLLAGNEMHFNLTKNANNTLSLTDDYAGDTSSVLYDSTEPVKYYLATKPSTESSAKLSLTNLDEAVAYTDSSSFWEVHDGSTVDSTQGGMYMGPGQYDADLIWNSDVIDDSGDTASRIVILSEREWKMYHYNMKWLVGNSLAAITVT